MLIDSSASEAIDDLLGLNQHEPFADLDSHLVPPDLPAGHHFDDLFELVVQRAPRPRPVARPRAAAGPGSSACSSRAGSTGFSR